MTNRPLTRKQKKVLTFVRKYLSKNQYPPTMREIGDSLGLRSINGVSEHLFRLERKGYLQLVPRISRGIRLTDKPL